MADQGGWNVVSSTPLKPEAATTQMSGGWNVVKSEPDDPLDYSAKYNTPIPPERQAEYAQWSKKMGQDPVKGTYDYDLQGAFLGGVKADGRGHLTDQWKKPNHPTFSNESQYNGKDGYTGGQWGNQNGKDTYQPSKTNLTFRTPEQLQQYFRKTEPDAQLLSQQPAQPVAAPVNGSGLVSPDDAVAAATQGANELASHVLGTGQTIGATQPSFLQRLIAPFTGPGSAYGAAESRRTGGPPENQFDKPLIDFRANDQFVDGPPIVRGFTKAVQSGLSGLTTPKNAALLIGMFGIGSLPVIGRLISAGFAGDMLYSAAKQSPQLKAQIKAGDVEGAAETATGMGINVGMASLSVAHALKPGERAAPAPPATANSTGAEPYAPVQPTVQTPVQPVAAPVAAAPVVTAEPVKAPRKPKTKPAAAPAAEPEETTAEPDFSGTKRLYEASGADSMLGISRTGSGGFEVTANKNRSTVTLGKLTPEESRKWQLATDNERSGIGQAIFHRLADEHEPAQPSVAPTAPVEGWNVVKSEPLKEKPHETQTTTVTAHVPATGADGESAGSVGEPEAKAEGGEKPFEKPVLKPEQTTVTTHKVQPLVSAEEGERAGQFKISLLKKGQPGISQEADPLSGAQSRMTVFVSRDTAGEPQGYLHFYLDDAKQGVAPPDHGLSPEVYVNPAARRKGVASGLYDAAKKAGYDLSQVSGRETTPAGAAFLNARNAPAETPSPKAETPAQPAQPVAAGPSIDDLPTGVHGPVAEHLSGKPVEAVRWLQENETGEVPAAFHNPATGPIDLIWGSAGNPAKEYKGGYGLAHILAKHEEMRGQIENLGDIVAKLTESEKQQPGGQEVRLEDARYRAVVSKVWQPKGQKEASAKTWLLTAFEPKEKPSPAADSLDAGSALPKQEGGASVPPGDGSSVSSVETQELKDNAAGTEPRKPQPVPARDKRPPATGNILFGSGNPVAGASKPDSPLTGDSSASVVEAPAPEPRKPSGPVYLGSGLGALEPLFREAKEAGDALRMQRNAALAAAKAAEAKPEEMKSGQMVRHYLTAERDLWAARTNQTIDVVTRKVLPKMQDREALGIAREYRNNPMELQSWIDGSHPFLEDADGGSATAMKRLDKLMPVMRNALRMIGNMSLREKAADKVFTNIATEDLAEGRKIGFLESRWLPDEYLPHALNKKGEGGVAKPPSTAGRQMGKIGKYFGFGERRSDRHPTLIHAVADGIIPKTLDPSALFTIHADGFARARATHLLEAHLVESGLGKWGDGKSTPEGWEQLAGHTEEFKHRQAYAVPGSFDPETRESELRVGLTGLYVKPFIAKALEPITDPDWTAKFPGFAKVRTAQRGLKEAILGLSGYHLLTENYMAAADMGLSAMYRAFRQPLEHPATLANERDLIGAGGTTSIQGSVMNAYRGMRPGTIPTRLEVIRGYLPGTKQALEVADSITRFTFDNVQRRYKVWAFALHRDAWVHDNPAATPEQLAEAKKGIASYVNGVYGGLHWENMGWSRAMVEIARLSFLAPDWSGSNMALAKYAADAPMSSEEIPFRSRLKGATSKESAQARLSRAFWTKQFVGGAIATQMLSLLITGKLSHRPFQVYLGKDPNGEDVYQNVFYRGSAGDTVSLWTKIEEHGLLVGSGLMVGSKLAPFAKVTEHLITGRDDLGRPITPKGMNPLVQTVRSVGSVMSEVSPVPITVRGIAKTTMGDQSGKYLWSERILGLFGPAAQHIPPAGTHMSGGVLRPNAEREENSAFDQMKTGQVYKRRGR